MSNEKIIHDMNSSLGALEQALVLMDENQEFDPEFLKRMIPLSRQKMSEILKLWAQLKKDRSLI